MSAAASDGNKEPEFWFEAVDAFDARGLRRCPIPGTGIYGAPSGSINADFWRNRQGQVLIRFSWNLYRYHYHVVLAGGEEVPDEKMDELLVCVDHIQDQWVAEAPDNDPEVPTKPDTEDD